jgi:hypothetical protein
VGGVERGGLGRHVECGVGAELVEAGWYRILMSQVEVYNLRFRDSRYPGRN